MQTAEIISLQAGLSLRRRKGFNMLNIVMLIKGATLRQSHCVSDFHTNIVYVTHEDETFYKPSGA